MSLNTTEFGVVERKSVFAQPVEQSIDLDFYLPENFPDVRKLLKCAVSPAIISKSVDSNRVSIDGTVNCLVLYCDKENNILSFTYCYPFNKSFELPQAVKSLQIRAKIKNEYMNTRLVSERRVEIHGAVAIYTDITDETTQNIICDIDDDVIYKKCGTINAVTPRESVDKHIIVEEEIDLSSGKPAIKSILRKSAVAKITESKIISNKAVIRGEVALKILYCPEPVGRPQCFEIVLPFSQMVELYGVDEECKCEANIEICSLEVDTKSGLSDEVRTIFVQAKMLLSASAYCDNAVPVVFDVFSSKYEINKQTDNVSFSKIARKVDEKFICKKVLEFSDNSIGSIIDIFNDADLSYVKNNEKQVTIGGVMNIGILGYDTGDEPVFYEKSVDYEYSFNLDEAPYKFKSNTFVQTGNISFNLLDSSRLEIRADLHMQSVIYDEIINEVLTQIEIDTSSKKENTALPLTLYYPSKGELVWDIAKRFNASPKEILALNELSDETLSGEKVLLIPSF